MGQAIRSYDTPLGKYWLHNGILHFQAGNGPRTMSHIHENFDTIRRAVNNRRICLLADLSDISIIEPDARDYMIREIQSTYSAVALISDSQLGNVVAKMFLMLKAHDFPARQFKDEKDAMAWLAQFRDPAFL